MFRLLDIHLVFALPNKFGIITVVAFGLGAEVNEYRLRTSCYGKQHIHIYIDFLILKIIRKKLLLIIILLLIILKLQQRLLEKLKLV